MLPEDEVILPEQLPRTFMFPEAETIFVALPLKTRDRGSAIYCREVLKRSTGSELNNCMNIHRYVEASDRTYILYL